MPFLQKTWVRERKRGGMKRLSLKALIYGGEVILIPSIFEGLGVGKFCLRLHKNVASCPLKVLEAEYRMNKTK